MTQKTIHHPMPNPNTRSARVLIKMLQAGRRDARRNQDYHLFCSKPRLDFRTGEVATTPLRFAAMAAHLIETAHAGSKLDSMYNVY